MKKVIFVMVLCFLFIWAGYASSGSVSDTFNWVKNTTDQTIEKVGKIFTHSTPTMPPPAPKRVNNDLKQMRKLIGQMSANLQEVQKAIAVQREDVDRVWNLWLTLLAKELGVDRIPANYGGFLRELGDSSDLYLIDPPIKIFGDPSSIIFATEQERKNSGFPNYLIVVQENKKGSNEVISLDTRDGRIIFWGKKERKPLRSEDFEEWQKLVNPK